MDLREELNRKAMDENPQVPAQVSYSSRPVISQQESNSIKMEQFQDIMNRIIANALQANNKELGNQVSSTVSEEVTERMSKCVTECVTEQMTDKVLKEMDYILRESDERGEERYRKLDETIRQYQQARAEAAAAEMNEYKHKKRGIFKKR